MKKLKKYKVVVHHHEIYEATIEAESKEEAYDWAMSDIWSDDPSDMWTSSVKIRIAKEDEK